MSFSRIVLKYILSRYYNTLLNMVNGSEPAEQTFQATFQTYQY